MSQLYDKNLISWCNKISCKTCYQTLRQYKRILMFFGTVRYVWFILYYITQMLSFHYITRTISHNLAKVCYNCHAAQRISLSLFFLCLSLDFSLSLFLCLCHCVFCSYLCMSVFTCLLYLSVVVSFSIPASLHFCLSSFLLCLCFSPSLPLCLSLCSTCLYFSLILSSVSLCLSLSLPFLSLLIFRKAIIADQKLSWCSLCLSSLHYA